MSPLSQWNIIVALQLPLSTQHGIMLSTTMCALFALCLTAANAYMLVHNYNHRNWYTSFTFEAVRLPSP